MRIAGGAAKRITKRIINFILVIWGVVTLSFCLQVFTGTDPAEMIVRKVNVFATEEQIQAVREELGQDAPFLERYTDYIKGVLTGDLGTAITNRQPVIENIKDALPVTCMLVVMAMACSPLLAAPARERPLSAKQLWDCWGTLTALMAKSCSKGKICSTCRNESDRSSMGKKSA